MKPACKPEVLALSIEVEQRKRLAGS